MQERRTRSGVSSVPHDRFDQSTFSYDHSCEFCSRSNRLLLYDQLTTHTLTSRSAMLPSVHIEGESGNVTGIKRRIGCRINIVVVVQMHETCQLSHANPIQSMVSCRLVSDTRALSGRLMRSVLHGVA